MFCFISIEFATYELKSSYCGQDHGLHNSKRERIWNQIFITKQEPDMAATVSYCCRKCGKVYTRKGNLQRHLSWECGKEPHQKCPYCPYATYRKSNVQEHIRRRHKNMKNIGWHPVSDSLRVFSGTEHYHPG